MQPRPNVTLRRPGYAPRRTIVGRSHKYLKGNVLRVLKLKIAVFVASVAAAAHADHHSLQVDDCSDRSVAPSHVGYLVEPWEDNIRYVPQHNLRFAVVGSGEPTPTSHYLMILGNAPQHESEVGPRLCRLVTIEGATGFSKIEMAAASVEETTRRGREFLILVVPVEITTGTGTTRRQRLSVGYLHENGNTIAKLLGN